MAIGAWLQPNLAIGNTNAELINTSLRIRHNVLNAPENDLPHLKIS